MNLSNLQQLIEIGYKQWKEDPQNEIVWQETLEKILVELSAVLDETIAYIDTCTEKELYYLSQIFEELSEHFKSQRLIDCVERNIARFDNPKVQEQLKMELDYMKLYI